MAKVILIIIIVIFVYALISTFRKKSSSQSDGANRQDSGNGTGTGRSGSRSYGKWIGGGLGWAFGGPLGAILGFALGSMYDGSNGNYRGTARGDFAMSLLVLSAAIMNADKKVLKSELDYVRRFFLNQFGEDETERLILMLKEILKQEINIPEVSAQVGRYMDYPSKLQLLHYLFGIASVDGQYHADEVTVIEQIAGYMGISAADFNSIKAMFVRDVNSAYDILEITPQATNDEVKKAYRRLAVEYHPDKVAHLGEDIRKSATEKFQKLVAAYEQVKKQRGMN